MKDRLVVLMDLNSLGWMSIMDNTENSLDIYSLVGIILDTIFLRYM